MKIREMMKNSSSDKLNIHGSLVDKFLEEKDLREKIVEYKDTLVKLTDSINKKREEKKQMIKIANDELEKIQVKVAKAKNQLEDTEKYGK